MPPSKQPESPKPAAGLPSSPATAPGGGVAPPSPPEPSLPKPPTCPTCDGVVEVYAGPNLHKRGTGWCIICGRVTL